MEGFTPETEEEKEICEYWKGVGASHSKPSPITLKIISKIDTSLGVMTEKMGNVQTDMARQHGENKEDHKIMKKGIKHTNGDVTELEKKRIASEARESLRRKYYGAMFTMILVIGVPMAGFTIKDYFSSRKSDIEQKLEMQYMKEALDRSIISHKTTAEDFSALKKNLENGEYVVEEINN